MPAKKKSPDIAFGAFFYDVVLQSLLLKKNGLNLFDT
jgi:hypothetical protein